MPPVWGRGGVSAPPGHSHQGRFLLDNQQGQEPGANGGQEPRPQESAPQQTDPKAEPKAAAASSGQEPETYDRAYVQKLRDEAARHRVDAKELRDAKAKLEEIELAKLGELERRDKQIAQLTAQVAELEQVTARADKYEAALQAHLVAQRKDLPRHIVELLDEKDPADQLAWLSKNAEHLGAAAARPGVPATPRASAPTQAQRIEELKKGYALPRL